MLKQRAKLVYLFLLAADILTTIFSFIAAYWIRNSYFAHRYGESGGLYPLDRYISLLSLVVVLWTILLMVFHAYRSYRVLSLPDEFLAIGKAVAVGGLIIGSIAFGAKFHFLSRMLILLFIVVNICLLTAERIIIRQISWFVRKRGYNFRNLVIVGTDQMARNIAKLIRQYDKWGLRVVGFVSEDDRSQPAMLDGYPVIGSLNDMEKIVKTSAVDDVIISVPGKKLEELEDTLLMLENHGINARIVSNIFPHLIAKMHVEEFETIPLLTFTTVPTNELALLVKRIFDLVAAVALTIASLPIMILTAVSIKLTSSGPVLFKQVRSGLHGRTFMLYKFRSMYDDAESGRKRLESLNEMDGPAFKIKDDPRITPVGRYIRSASIDELPQLWNVLRGDMSIVGPRPPLPEEVEKYQRWQWRRLSMRPGLTCLWQISGRSRISDFDEWVRLDLQYIDTWSLGLDFKIFMKTIPVVLSRKGAE